ncbi:MAG TPA: hypothetical protein VHV75_07990 [Solirubrobacteraceae bacterium]|jgi:hypothetical protein|nr:hypothetical protein [Solirubrobacteraceae bacterium]
MSGFLSQNQHHHVNDHIADQLVAIQPPATVREVRWGPDQDPKVELPVELPVASLNVTESELAAFRRPKRS